MWKRSPAQRFASSPPSAPRISTITFLPSLGSLRDEQLAEPGVELGELRLLRRRSRSGGTRASRRRSRRASISRASASSASVGAVLAVRVDDRLQLGDAAGPASRGRLLVAGRVDLGQLRLELLQLGLELREAFEHVVQGTGGPPPPLLVARSGERRRRRRLHVAAGARPGASRRPRGGVVYHVRLVVVRELRHVHDAALTTTGARAMPASDRSAPVAWGCGRSTP